MKNHFCIAIVFVFLFVLASCGMHVLRGSGEVTTMTSQVASFNAVVIDASLNTVVAVQAGSQPAVQLSGYANLLKHIKTTVENNTLHIYTDLDSYWIMESDGMKAVITLPAIAALTLNGANNAEVHGPVQGGRFVVEISGSGDVTADNITADSFLVVLSGSGDVRVNGGTVKYAEYEINGSGGIKAASLQAGRAMATINGSGDITVNAVQKLIAGINGSGSILYKGSPEVSQDISGSGNISKM